MVYADCETDRLVMLSKKAALRDLDDWISTAATAYHAVVSMLRVIRHFARHQEGGERMRELAEAKLAEIGADVATHTFIRMSHNAATHVADGRVTAEAATSAVRAWLDAVAPVTNASQHTLRLMRIFNTDHLAERIGEEPSFRSEPLQTNGYARAFNDPRLTPLAPTNILIDSTNRCNFRCVTCDQSFDQRFAQFDLTWFNTEHLKPHLAQARTMHLAGRGEPLLSPTVWEMIDAAVQGRCSIGMTTNGSLIHRLSKVPADAVTRFHIGLSFDGGRQETVEAIRKGFSWDKVLKNIRALPDNLKSRVVLAMTVNRLNYKEIPDLVELALELGLGGVNLQQFYVFLPWHGDMQMTRQDWDEMSRLVDGLRHEPKYAGLVINDFTYRPAEAPDRLDVPVEKVFGALADIKEKSYGPAVSAATAFSAVEALPFPPLPDFLLSASPKSPPPRAFGAWRSRLDSAVAPLAALASRFSGAEERRAEAAERPRKVSVPACVAPWMTAYLQSDGGVRPCCTIHSPMGSIVEESIEQIWSGESYRLLRRALVTGENLPSSCVGCKDSTRFAHLAEAVAEILEEDPHTEIEPLFALEELPDAVRQMYEGVLEQARLRRVAAAERAEAPANG